MKHFAGCYCVHLGTATVVSLFLWAASVVGNIFASVVPIFSAYIIVLVQILLSIPFCKLFPKAYAEKTAEYVPEEGVVGYYSSFLLVHVLSIFVIFVLFYGYFGFVGMKEEIAKEISVFMAAPELYADALSELYIFDGFLDSAQFLFGALPEQIMNYMDRMILSLALYSVAVFGLMVFSEYLRVKACDDCIEVKEKTTYTYTHR